MKYYLAVDIGASSGRCILGHFKNDRLFIEEVYRFENGIKLKDGHKIWDIDYLFKEIIKGLKKCKDLNKIPSSMAIDTWAVDYVLLDKNDNRLTEVYSYRDDRTLKIDKEVYKLISEEELYLKTGIQKQIFNTIYQLMETKIHNPKVMDKAKSLLMIPDYLNFLLTGNKKQEYTNSSTTQLLNPITKTWDYKLIDKLGLPKDLFKEISMPKTFVGKLKKEIENEVGYNLDVVLCASHDTASAIMAIPTSDSSPLYISSGTWSLMGCERSETNCTIKSKIHNFTNEGGYEYRYRYLKNIMGLWMIQSVKKEIANDISYDCLCKKASLEKIESIVDVNDLRFLAPVSMSEEVKQYCKETSQEVPVTVYQIAAVIYNSLAKCYKDTLVEIEDLTNKKYESIYVVGGGSNADYLNKLTAKCTNIDVYAGPSEATAIGNILCQMLKEGIFKDLKDARRCVLNSFEIKKYKGEEKC